MAFASTSNYAVDNSENFDSTSRSCFHKTICLQDWWLIKSKDDSGRNRLAVAGFTSRDQQAVRVFSSAPILKRCDVFTLETIDGIVVMIKGFINKVRTKENGFPPEVFDHFVFGFPPYWEEYAAKSLEGQFTTEVVSRSHMSFEKSSVHLGATVTGDFTEGFSKDSRKINEKVHDTSSKLNSGIYECEASVLENDQCKCDKTNSGAEHFQDTVLDNGKQDLYASVCHKCLVEDASASQVVLENTFGFLLKESNLQNQQAYLSSCFDKKLGVDIDFNVSSIDHEGTALTSETESPSVKAQGQQKETSGFNCYVKPKSKQQTRKKHVSCECDSVLDVPDNQLEENLKNKSSTARFDGVINISEDVASSSAGRISKCQLSNCPRKEDHRLAANMSKTDKNKSNYVSVGGSDQMNDFKANVECGLQGRSSLNLPDPEIQESTGGITASTLKYGFVEGSSERTGGLKNKNKTVGSSIGSSEKVSKFSLGVKKFSAESTSRKKTKRKLTYASPVTRREREKASIISPESLSLKRSRSGRLLLPTLEFWRNQTAVYDADRRVTGIKVPAPSTIVTGKRSEPQTKQK